MCISNEANGDVVVVWEYAWQSVDVEEDYILLS